MRSVYFAFFSLIFLLSFYDHLGDAVDARRSNLLICIRTFTSILILTHFRISTMAPKSESPSLSLTLLETLRLKLPKSFSPAFVSDVYGGVSTYEDIDDLLASGYFENIAWKFFHADVTNNHLELILLMVFYEFEFLNTANCLKHMEADLSRLQDILLRVLQTTLNTQETNSRIEAASFLFLSTVVRYDSSTLLKCKLYSKWISTVSERFVSHLSTDSRETNDIVEHFLYFAICGSMSLEDIRSVFHPLRISARLAHHEVESHTRIHKLASILSGILYKSEDGDSFIEIRLALKRQGVPSLDAVVYASSRFDVNREQLVSDLTELPEAKVEEIAKSLGYDGVMGVEFLPHVIAEIVVGHHPFASSCSTLTEHELFDDFEESENGRFMPPLNTPTTKENLLALLKTKAVLALSKLINVHIVRCLNRLTITDPSNDNGIRGSSKYFLRPSAIVVDGAFAKLSAKKLLPDIKTGDRVVLLEMQKPNKFDASSRMQKYGIFTARVTHVSSISTDGAITVAWKFPGFEKRFNAILRLPQDFTAFEALEQAIADAGKDAASPLIGGENNKLGLAVSVDSVTFDALLEVVELRSPKKRKTDSGTQDVIEFNGSNVVLDTGKAILTGPQAKGLLDMVTLKSVHLSGEPTGYFPLVAEYLRVLSHNWPKEKCLIIVPHTSAVQLFPVVQNLKVLKYRDPEEITQINQRKAEYLGRVAKLAAHLGLSECDFAKNIRNALMLYYCHVKPRWEAFLGQLTKLKERAAKYPFRTFEFGDISVEQLLVQVVDHYSSVKGIFSELQRLAPLSLGATTDDIHGFLVHRERYVVASVEDAATLMSNFDRIVLFGGIPQSVVPVLRSRPRLVTVLGPAYVAPTKSENVPNSACFPSVRGEIARLYGAHGTTTTHAYNLGLKYAAQNISVPSSPGQVNVEEAKYCVYLFQYLRLLGYPHHLILIAVWSPYMLKLIEEILEEQNIGRNTTACDDRRGFRFGWPVLQLVLSVFPVDYLIVSTHGDISFRGWSDGVRAARLGLYTIGASAVGKIQNGPFELFTGGSFDRGNDDRENSDSYVMDDAEHMGEYIGQMTQARTSFA